MIKSRSHIEVRYRSLLQKAVRRGHTDLVLTTSALLESLSSREKNWYRTRTAIITFEECWPLGSELVFNRKFHSKVAALMKVTRSSKLRDAAGLGYLASALIEGDTAVLDGTTDDKHVRIIADAIKRPDAFWQWIAARKKSDEQKALIENAMRYKQEGLPRDRAVIQAAAYLSVIEKPPLRYEPALPDQAFPYWVAFDKHTPEGRLVLRDVSRDLHIPQLQLEWTFFYFEGAKTNGEIPSKWWARNCRRHFKKVGLAIEEAHLLWEPAKPQMIEALDGYGRHLQKELYRWKLSNLKQVEALERQVELFIEHFEAVHRDQMKLFDKDHLDNI
ncbi:MAG: hypothetical protein V2J65_23805 [Desulfobacteraceae bacterium]|jgi:hypothetical protein|nr:hypothetical protein [Desulfobacteraceae bacterium]